MITLSQGLKKLTTLPEHRRRAQLVKGLVDRHDVPLVRIGSVGAGWIVPKATLIPGATAVCVGAGEDISFDVELNKLGMRVVTVDPTPRAIKHVSRVLESAARGETFAINNSRTEHYDLTGFEPSRLTLLQVGLSDSNGKLRFWAPKNPAHVSHSIVNLQHTDEYFEAECIRLQELCADNRIEKIAIFKIDVEGAEYKVLKDLTTGPVRPRAVCVEFDEGPNLQDRAASERIVGAVQEMKKAGYRLLCAEQWNLTFSSDGK